ncbi:BnaC08g15030D [Brassica napus]|uniref:(rape) hypothetical protein n=1 Tax=Brassica napus TaxID=3708 RepID=A0A078J3J6_BRANA|nr:unnamed protein product [Brassica napus]CDY57049.1 BnaC08g15030D [Brassica napus]
MKSRSRSLATMSLMIITEVLPLCRRECMPICMKAATAQTTSQQICEGACQAGCVQLQGRGPRGTGLSATDQGVDMVIA